MNNRLTWADYVRALSTNQSEIALKAETSQSTVSRWINGKSIPDATTVVKLARAYGLNPVAALVVAEYLDRNELTQPVSWPNEMTIRQYTDHEIALEMLRRVEAGSSPELEAPLDSDHPAMQEHEAQRNVTLGNFGGNDGGFTEDALHGLDTAAGTDETQADED